MRGWFSGKGFTVIMGSATNVEPMITVTSSAPVAPVNALNARSACKKGKYS